ncbi:DUF5666 domain-containing protein [Leifsonia shinshuensis]|uniref:DUF5666 domain-containing protein n=1 Tax=Leifsonia shinshuensis TaxID=150026 RepID=UPI00285F03F5|nr:DUF5666 domain-containing protein [Leifsonia shinshuensis]MDR6970091.1 hypothetical protein [Leifsonia shinshuensis]
MSNTQPTEPLPPRHEPPASPYAPGVPRPAGGPGAVGPEPFYKRHGLAFAISTLVLSIVILLGLITAGGFAVANVAMRVGERFISHSQPHQVHPAQPGVPGLPGRPGDGNGGGTGGKQGGGDNPSRELVRGTIDSISGDTWTLTRQNGGTVTVTVDKATAYGLPGQPATASDFAKGDEVVIIGTRTDDGVTATRVLKLAAFPTRPPSTPGAPQTPGS